MNYGMDFPAVEGRVVCQGHADYCRENGHATHTNNGVVSLFCPRCGDALDKIEVPARPKNWTRGANTASRDAIIGYMGSMIEQTRIGALEWEAVKVEVTDILAGARYTRKEAWNLAVGRMIRALDEVQGKDMLDWVLVQYGCVYLNYANH